MSATVQNPSSSGGDGGDEGRRAGGAKKNAGDNKENRTKSRKLACLDLNRFLDKRVHIKFYGGREVSGVLKGFDPLLNIVLDDTHEYLRSPEEYRRLTDQTRALGLVICRGNAIVVICPQDGYEPIQNPFVAPDE